MPKQEKLYKVKAVRGVMFRGEALKAGDEVMATLFEARSMVGTNGHRAVFVDGEKPAGPMTAEGAGKATIKGK